MSFTWDNIVIFMRRTFFSYRRYYIVHVLRFTKYIISYNVFSLLSRIEKKTHNIIIMDIFFYCQIFFKDIFFTRLVVPKYNNRYFKQPHYGWQYTIRDVITFNIFHCVPTAIVLVYFSS